MVAPVDWVVWNSVAGCQYCTENPSHNYRQDHLHTHTHTQSLGLLSMPKKNKICLTCFTSGAEIYFPLLIGACQLCQFQVFSVRVGFIAIYHELVSLVVLYFISFVCIVSSTFCMAYFMFVFCCVLPASNKSRDDNGV